MKNFKKRIMGMALTLAMVISALPGISVGAAEGDYMLFNAEFNGADNKALWVPFQSNGNTQYTDGRESGTIADGVLTTTPASTGFGCWGAYWGTENAISAKDGDTYKENIYIETKFKVQGQFASGESKILDVRGHCEANGVDEKAMFRAGIINNKLSLGDETKTTETDYALTLDTWYTIKSRLDFSAKKVYTTITDESGNSKEYESGFMWGANFSNIQSISLHRNDVAGTTYVTDYVRLYDLDDLGIVTASYEGKNLENASNVPNEFVAELTFTNAITEADMNKISVDNNAETQMVLSEDGKTVMMLLTGLSEGTKYTINVPELSGNSGKNISFKTAENTCFLIKAEFDGTDDETNWKAFDYSGSSFSNNATSGAVSNGVLTTTPGNTGWGCWGIYFGTGSDALQIAPTKENIYLETKFKIEGSIVDTRIWMLRGRRTSQGETDNLDFADMFISNGKLAVGNRVDKTETDYKFSTDTWYTLKSRISFKDKKVYTDIVDENGNSGSYTSDFTWGQAFEDITLLSLHNNNTAGVTYVTDYVRLWDADLVEPVEVKYGKDFTDLDGAEGIGSELTATVLFPMTVTENDVKKIRIDGAEVSAKLADDNKTVTLTISGLEYRRQYNLVIPAVGMNQEKTVSFTTADDPKYYFRAEFDGIDEKTLWNAYGADGNKKDIDFDSLIDADSGEITMSAGNVSFGRMKIEFPEAIDVTGKDNVIWETKLSFKNAITENKRFMGINAYQAGHIEISVIDSKFCYGGVEGGGITDTGVLVEAGKEYILSVSMNFVEDRYTLTIKDADEKVLFAGEKVEFGYGIGTNQVDYIDLPSLLDGNTVTIDYVRLYDGDYIDVSEFSAQKPMFDKDKLTVGEAVTATVNYQSPDERDIALIIATYDSDNRLTGITKVETVTEVKSKDSVELTVTPKTGDAKIKAFCWNNLSGMRALSDANELK